MWPWRRKQASDPRTHAMFTGNCVIREHTGDGHYVGRCDFATYNHICPRHGIVVDYPNDDDRDITVDQRRRSWP